MKPKSTPDAASLREQALRYLARREHSRFELTRKLEYAGFAIHDVASLLDEFEEKGWLSDHRFARNWIADRQAKAGSVKLTYDLRQRGIPNSIIEAILGNNRDSEIERAHEVWRKKFGTPPADAADKARQMRFLQSRGFTSEAIRRVMTDGKICLPGISE